jgi:TPP-dependent pyruvate/acetoin dehydrogenase alpha subunit
MQPDLWTLYRQMQRCRQFEDALRTWWRAGQIFGELHLGLGEEALVVGVVNHLRDGDALALDHRGTPPLIVRGADPISLARECLGHPGGTGGGRGGHMHLFAPDLLAASSGIVGASGPAAAGFALAAQHLRPGAVSVAFFGEGAMNQGMLLEALNLAMAWRLPVLFVCKDNAWAITTASPEVTGGSLLDRARSFGMPAQEIDGLDVEAVWQAARDAITHAREGHGPAFLLGHCVHLEGHFLGDPMLRIVRRPLAQARQLAMPLVRAAFRPGGAPPRKRATSLGHFGNLIRVTAAEQTTRQRDPVARLRHKLREDPARLRQIEAEVRAEMQAVVAKAPLREGAAS